MEPPAFDRTALHSKAAASFEELALALLDRFEPRPRQERAEPFTTRHTMETIHAISSPPVAAYVDFANKLTGWWYYRDGTDYALTGDNYRALRELVERIRRKSPFTNGFSDHFLEEAVTTWCAAKHKCEDAGPFVAFLLDHCAEAWSTHDFLLPLVGVEVEHDFTLGAVRVRTIPPELFERAAAEARARRPDDPDAGKSADALGETAANLAAVAVRVTGEPRFADSQAREIADDIAGVLRFMSPGAISSTVPSLVQPWGIKTVPQTLVMKLDGERLAGYSRQWLHGGLAMWKLGAPEIERLTATNFASLAIFFDGTALNDYAAHVRPAFFAFARAIGQFEPVDRLVGAITALECLLLRDQNEPLQQMVGERLAFLTASGREDRQRTVADYKAAYGLRSRAVHHLRGMDNEQVADRLFRHAFLAFVRAIEGLSVLTTHVQFLDGLDRIKFGGRYRDNDDDRPATEPAGRP
ncbi:hypothetical protein [Sphingomonas kyeonggiensis]|uniref:Apea-like HEPN domain-containing protein n=1 Tax=Sphingomonas kyeonggiensis TaxID=1268553 RepID=A0A7W6JWE4_9SPHN|nr:hypothetical protein [Sphingomonas kyeonggiensis]MBB4100758.1 hypothetical protein [Sphingomonas kyeonggiensis]